MNVEALKKAKIGLIFAAIIEFAIGIIFVVYPKFSLHVISLAVGISFILQGIFRIVHFVKDRLPSLLAKLDLLFGIALLVLGALLLITHFQLDVFIGIVLAVILLINGVSKLKVALEIRKLGFRYWWITAALAALTIVIAIALLFNLSAGGIVVAVFIGLSLLFDALLNGMAIYSAKNTF